MMTRDAAGRYNGLIESFVAKELSALSEYVRHALHNATTLGADPNDTHGHRRSAEVGDAVKLAKGTANLCMALARLRGETTHRTIVLDKEPPRDEPPEAWHRPDPPHYEGEPPLLTHEEWRDEALSYAQIWERTEQHRDERARRAGWIAGEPPPSETVKRMLIEEAELKAEEEAEKDEEDETEEHD
jgi:hypothetical protein